MKAADWIALALGAGVVAAVAVTRKAARPLPVEVGDLVTVPANRMRGLANFVAMSPGSVVFLRAREVGASAVTGPIERYQDPRTSPPEGTAWTLGDMDFSVERTAVTSVQRASTATMSPATTTPATTTPTTTMSTTPVTTTPGTTTPGFTPNAAIWRYGAQVIARPPQGTPDLISLLDRATRFQGGEVVRRTGEVTTPAGWARILFTTADGRVLDGWVDPTSLISLDAGPAVAATPAPATGSFQSLLGARAGQAAQAVTPPAPASPAPMMPSGGPLRRCRSDVKCWLFAQPGAGPYRSEPGPGSYVALLETLSNGWARVRARVVDDEIDGFIPLSSLEPATPPSSAPATPAAVAVSYLTGEQAAGPELLTVVGEVQRRHADMERYYREVWRPLNGGASLPAGLPVRSHARSFDRQAEIVEGQLRALGVSVASTEADLRNALLRILTTVAMPGHSRHHWGTDIDVGSPESGVWRPGGAFAGVIPFLEMEAWRFGFYNPYRDGAFPEPTKPHYDAEPWHLSYFPIASALKDRWALLVKPNEEALLDRVAARVAPAADVDQATLRRVLGTLDLPSYVTNVAPVPTTTEARV